MEPNFGRGRVATPNGTQVYSPIYTFKTTLLVIWPAFDQRRLATQYSSQLHPVKVLVPNIRLPLRHQYNIIFVNIYI
jgi:hypothetical protein